MSDNRISPRRRVFKAGTIVFNQGSSVLDCTLRNISETGALLSVANALTVPREFELRWDGNIQRCTVVWRKFDAAGVRFAK